LTIKLSSLLLNDHKLTHVSVGFEYSRNSSKGQAAKRELSSCFARFHWQPDVV